MRKRLPGPPADVENIGLCPRKLISPSGPGGRQCTKKNIFDPYIILLNVYILCNTTWFGV